MIRTIRLQPSAYEPRRTVGGGEVRNRMPYEGATDYVTDGEQYGVRYEDGSVDWLGDSPERAFGDDARVDHVESPGEAYRALRERAGLTQAEAGARVGTHANTIARRERGEVPVDREAWLAMEYVTRAP